ncbi:CocE/NonD family hydrolase [Ktedonosporobacter rubrisoli]|uniref:CocE/NonD family hydrolase n=1 Tax=Ktedonosporobacter rubrisoli TaxID=2509675 RepID=A0A4P6JMD1_KTERU|nr:CocE/NonD family hydrolase [Ktedonosporobacter rubrisoli]QBD76447.1 CocE/NonD family hydrolase [Ktedonosporobacter rubrisoli]
MEIIPEQGVITEKNIMVPMRDGVRLATDVYRPDNEEAVPTLLTRLPYDKGNLYFLILNFDAAWALQNGYAIVVQDTRGRFASEGTFSPGEHEATDGFDTLAWIASQPWSNGKVGMFGESYQALTQWQTAVEQPTALRTIAPMHAPFNLTYFYQNGAFLLGLFLWWAFHDGALAEVQRRLPQGRATEADVQGIMQALNSMQQQYEHLPLADMPLLRDTAPYYQDWLTSVSKAAKNQSTQPKSYQDITVPTLNIGGWFDPFFTHVIKHYQRMKQEGGSALARQQARLIIGPWAHIDFPENFPERHYGPKASVFANLPALQQRWFEHWLKGIENGVEQEKPVSIFVMGADNWRDEDAWPLPDTRYRPFYLHSQGRANRATGDGFLSISAPLEEPADVYCYDPRNPVPTVGGAVLIQETTKSPFNWGPRDQQDVEKRADVLCYTSEALRQPVEVTGPLELILYISSSARDTDFTGKLVDVYPDGRAEILTDGILRARYRESLAAPVLMEPGQIYELHLDLGATSNLFKEGHRIRLEVSSSNFPRFDRNTNTGGNIYMESTENLVQATNYVYHDQHHASHLLLPMIERT